MDTKTLTIVPIDAKRAPRAPKLVPVLARRIDELEKIRAYGKDRIVRVLAGPRGQILWHLDGRHRIAWTDARGETILGSLETRGVDASSKERGSLVVSAEGDRVLFTDRVTVHELDLATGLARVVWREERDDLEPGPREAVYAGDAIVVSTLDALWLLERTTDGAHAPIAVAPLQGFSHTTSLPDGQGVVVCTFACEDEAPAVRVFRIAERSLRCIATLSARLSEPVTIDGRVFAKSGKQTVELVGLTDVQARSGEEAPGLVCLRARDGAAPKPELSSERAKELGRIVAYARIPRRGWLLAVEGAAGNRVLELDADGREREFELPPGFHADLAVSPDGLRAIVGARRRIDRDQGPRSLLLDLARGTHTVFGATTVHAFVTDDTVLAGVALMDVDARADVPEGLGLHATRPIKATVTLPGHRAKPRRVAIDRARGRALIQTNHGDGVLVAVTPTSLRILGTTPLRPAEVYTGSDGSLCMLCDGAHYAVELEAPS